MWVQDKSRCGGRRCHGWLQLKIVMADFSDFVAFPTGGILTWNRSFIRAAHERGGVSIGLIGWARDVRSEKRESQVRVGPGHCLFTPVGEGPSSGLIPDKLRFLARPLRWRWAIAQHKSVDWYYCHSAEGVLAVAAIAKGARIALHLHGATNGVGISRFAWGRRRSMLALYEATILRRALGRANAVIATVSLQDFHELSRSQHIRAGVPLLRTTAMTNITAQWRRGSKRLANGSALRLVCVGRLVEMKGVDLLLGTVKVLRTRGFECHFDVVGEGTERQRLTSLAADIGIADCVRFHGDLRHDDALAVVDQADVFVSGSRKEGFSNALLEALALGVPAVVSDVGSAREVVIGGRTGYVVSDYTPEAFADAISEVASRDGAMSEDCQGVAAAYRGEHVVAQVLEVLRSGLNQTAARGAA